MKPPEVVAILQKLIEPCSDASLSLEDALKMKLDSIGADLNNASYSDETFSEQRWPLEKYAWWNFVDLVMRGLLLLKTRLLTAPTEVDRLLSIAQKKTLNSSLEMAISLGIVAHLPHGVGVGIERRSVNHALIFPSDLNLTPLLKFYCVEYTCRGLLSLFDEETFRDAIVNRHLGDLLAGLFHLLLLQDPGGVPAPFGLLRNRYKKHLSEILESTCQPRVVTELMVLYGNKDCPPKLGRALRGLLTDRLMAEGGVVATVRAILDVIGLAADSPMHSQNALVLAKLIVTPHTKDVDSYYKRICPTVMSLLTNKEPQFVQISVMCLKSLNESKPDLFKRHFLDHIVQPLRMTSTEKEVTLCIDRLHNCFAIPSSEMWSLSTRLLHPLVGPLFLLHWKVYGSACAIKSKVEDLAWCTLRDAEGADLEEVLDAAVLEESGLKFEFGEEGGVSMAEGVDRPNLEEATDCLLGLVASRDAETGAVKAKLFNKSLQFLADSSAGLGQRLLAAKLLSVLATEPQVFGAISRDPRNLIAFLKTLLEEKVESSDSDIISVGLMVLGAVLGDTSTAAGRDWNQFTPLVATLRTLKDLPQGDVRLTTLAEEIYCLILTHGVVSRQVLGETGSVPTLTGLIEELDSVTTEDGGECNTAINEACDPLLPVRAHALRVLSKLILAGDKTAKMKRQAILCLFKENLKDSDSYLYLSAIDGLASMGSIFPSEVLLTLTEQYVECKEVELRMKVGEVLIKLTRNMDELVYNYKAELLNAVLYGCRDSDPLIRASSLSNLGELCKILTFRVGVFAIEIFDCVQSIFETDKAPEARRAAIMVLTLILNGLGTSALSVLEPVLLEMYRRLKKAYTCEKDEVVRLHAQLALEEINTLTRAYLMPEQKFVKRIYVLDPPTS